MKIQRTGDSAPSLRIAVLCAFCAAWPHAYAAPAAPAKPGVKGASGTAFQFEESPGSLILYQEAKGGMLVPTASPPPANTRAPMPLPDSSGTGATAPRPPTKAADAPKTRKDGP